MSDWQFWMLMFSLWFSTTAQFNDKVKPYSLADIFLVVGFFGSFIMLIKGLV